MKDSDQEEVSIQEETDSKKPEEVTSQEETDSTKLAGKVKTVFFGKAIQSKRAGDVKAAIQDIAIRLRNA